MRVAMCAAHQHYPHCATRWHCVQVSRATRYFWLALVVSGLIPRDITANTYKYQVLYPRTRSAWLLVSWAAILAISFGPLARPRPILTGLAFSSCETTCVVTLSSLSHISLAISRRRTMTSVYLCKSVRIWSVSERKLQQYNYKKKKSHPCIHAPHPGGSPSRAIIEAPARRSIDRFTRTRAPPRLASSPTAASLNK